jgi:catechol 2,3-dioxygenase-like lactoylglutathione lyase family enzyme
MWGAPPFVIADNCAVDVRNLARARDWYKDKLTFRESKTRREDDSGRPFVDLYFSHEETFLTLAELEVGASAKPEHVIFYAKNLEKARDWLAQRGVAVQAITADSGGDAFFVFQDLDGNRIEVCVEP